MVCLSLSPSDATSPSLSVPGAADSKSSLPPCPASLSPAPAWPTLLPTHVLASRKRQKARDFVRGKRKQSRSLALRARPAPTPLRVQRKRLGRSWEFGAVRL